MTRKRKIILGIAIALALFPINARCGSPQYGCAVAPPPGETEASYTDEVEPALIYFLEYFLPINPPIYYYSYRD